jgi:hypothetical protein
MRITKISLRKPTAAEKAGLTFLGVLLCYFGSFLLIRRVVPSEFNRLKWVSVVTFCYFLLALAFNFIPRKKP